MYIIYDILLIVLLLSCVIRHIVRTMTFISDLREKAENRRFKRFNH